MDYVCFISNSKSDLRIDSKLCTIMILSRNHKIPNEYLSISSSLGQGVHTSNSNELGNSKDGIQHAFEILCSTGLKKAEGIALEISVFPQAAKDRLNLSVGNYNIQNLSYQVYTNHGQLIENKNINRVNTAISFGRLSSGIYVVLISEYNQTIKSFKLIKK